MVPKRFKIAVIVRDSVGGICRYSHELARALSTEGVEVTLICRSDFPRFDGEVYKRLTLFGVTRKTRDGPMSKLISRINLLLESIVQPIVALRFCSREKIDVAHFSNTFHLGFFVWRFFISSGLVMGVSVHDVKRRSCGWFGNLMNRQLRGVYAKASALFVHDSDAVFGFSEFLREQRVASFVVPHGHFSYPRGGGSVLRVARRENTKTGLFFGSIRDEKRLDLLLRALALRRTNPDWRLIVAGSSAGGQHRPLADYKTLAVSLGIEQQIEFFDGYIPDEEVYQFFEAADWVGLVYDGSFTSQSGVLATAVDVGVPVLCSGAPLIDKTVRIYRIGHACAGDGPAEILAGIEDLERRDGDEFRPGFERFVREMTWEANAKITFEAYESAISARKVTEV
jgi:glycosyltransferase involved in cell wall biosynthesis